MPGTEQQKKFLLNCIGCHTLERIMKSSYDAEGMIEVINRMATYYPGTTPLRPQRLAGNFQRMRDRGNVKPIVEWLATINLSQQDTWQFPLKTLPRPTGKSTQGHLHRIRSAGRRTSSRTTWCSIARATSGTPTSARCSSARWTRRPAR